MPSPFISLRTLVLIAFLPVLSFAQGSLTPPGAPGPTMKTLAQVEPRIPLVEGSPGITINESGGITIQSDGSYYLTKDLIVQAGDGITISQGINVTLDLMGFSIKTLRDGNTGTAIAYPAAFNKNNEVPRILIRNGHIRFGHYIVIGGVFSSFLHGIVAPAIVEDIIISDSLQTGISALVVRRCQVVGAFQTAIDAVDVTDCTVREFSLIGINASGRVSNSTVLDTYRSGTTAINAPLVESCIVRFVYETSDVQQIRGILATIAKSCYVSGPASTGIDAQLAVGCATFGVAGNTIASKQDMP